MVIHFTKLLPVAGVYGLQDPWVQCNALETRMKDYAGWHITRHLRTLFHHLYYTHNNRLNSLFSVSPEKNEQIVYK
jgi:hypothetical protein